MYGLREWVVDSAAGQDAASGCAPGDASQAAAQHQPARGEGPAARPELPAAAEGPAAHAEEAPAAEGAAADPERAPQGLARGWALSTRRSAGASQGTGGRAMSWHGALQAE